MPDYRIANFVQIAARRWVWLVLAIWMTACACFLYSRWSAIHWIALGDTDDNLRLLQVRAWLDGQSWYDLRVYKLDPPRGADIHWSRVVDLPIAALILLARNFTGAIGAERFAVAVAPLIPLLVASSAIALTARRVIAPAAGVVAMLLLILCTPTMAMFMPLRIDHHGWQLAAVALVVLGLADPNQRRGGVIAGFATALSMSIGIEMIPYLAIAGSCTVLRWVIDSDQRSAMRAYGFSLSGGISIGYLAFASFANAAPRCDALTPVWFSTLGVVGVMLAALSLATTRDRWVRLILAGSAGAVLVVAFVIMWPQCIGRPEGVSPELDRLWLQNIREVKPLYTQPWITIIPCSLALFGIIGSLIVARKQLMAWFPLALLALASGGLMFWQTRAAPAALMLSILGATWLIWAVAGWLRDRKGPYVAASAVIAAILLVSGVGVQVGNWLFPISPVSAGIVAVNRANRTCPTLPALRPIAQIPATTIFTFVDLSPRLITMTHHKAIAGPYHRNGDAILDVHHAFRGTAAEAREIIARHGATLLLICPDMSESTLYRFQNRQGFYAQLIAGHVPPWLTRVPLPAGSPFILWHVRKNGDDFPPR